MVTRTIRVGLCGYGFAGKGFHAPLIRATSGLELAVVASSRPDAVRADLPHVAVVDTPEAVMDRVDLVVLAGPHESHAPLAIAALARGCHVVVDKPLALTLADARAVGAAAARAGAICAVFHNRRWDNDFLGLLELVRTGAIGELVHVESHFDRFRPEVRARWREQPGPSGGLWFDLGPHLVDQALRLFGTPRSVLASLAAQRPGAQTDDWAHVVLDHGRTRVILHASLLAAAPSPRFVVHGTRGSWVKWGLDVQEAQLLSGLRPGMPGWGVDPRPARLYDGTSDDGVPAPLPAGSWESFYANVLDALTGVAPLAVPLDQAIATVAVTDAALTSARTGRAITPEIQRAPEP